MPTPLPNQGRYSNLAPPSLDWIYPDPDSPLQLTLLVVPPAQPHSITLTRRMRTSKDNHWALYWPIHPPTPHSQSRHIIRRIHVQHDPGRDHLTFWGPLTVVGEEDDVCKIPRMRRFELGMLEREERRALETIAGDVEVMEADGQWNCQDWITDVVRKSVENGILEKGKCERVLEEAGRVPPARLEDATPVDPSYTSVMPVV